jgi:hypothetical protein
MRLIKFLFPVGILAMGLVLNTLSYGKAEYTKQEKKACTACHVKNGKKELNDTGKCYGEKKSLAACEKK